MLLKHFYPSNKFWALRILSLDAMVFIPGIANRTFLEVWNAFVAHYVFGTVSVISGIVKTVVVASHSQAIIGDSALTNQKKKFLKRFLSKTYR